MKQKFADYFQKWNITLPEKDVEIKSSGLIKKDGWAIKYIFGKEVNREYVEFYAFHIKLKDRHERIYTSGVSDTLETLNSGYTFDPAFPGDEERMERAYYIRNSRIFEEMQEKGLTLSST